VPQTEGGGRGHALALRELDLPERGSCRPKTGESTGRSAATIADQPQARGQSTWLVGPPSEPFENRHPGPRGHGGRPSLRRTSDARGARPLNDCSIDGKDLDGHREPVPSGPAFRRPKRKNRPPNRGPVLSYRASQSGAYFLIVRVADLVFRQTSTPLFSATFGAMARYLPGLPLVFFE